VKNKVKLRIIHPNRTIIGLIVAFKVLYKATIGKYIFKHIILLDVRYLMCE